MSLAAGPVAAVDLGSNSFHMLVAQTPAGARQVVIASRNGALRCWSTIVLLRRRRRLPGPSRRLSGFGQRLRDQGMCALLYEQRPARPY